MYHDQQTGFGILDNTIAVVLVPECQLRHVPSVVAHR